MSDELKPCAHCGGGHVVEEWRREDDRTVYWTIWRVACGRCGMGTDWHASREAAIDIWNKRADEFGADDDYERRMDELLCRLTNGKWSKSRSYSVDFMVSCVDEAYDEILDPPVESDCIDGKCPTCGAKVRKPEQPAGNAQADSREQLEADVHSAIFQWGWDSEWSRNAQRINERVAMLWLDRQAAITRAEVFSNGGFDCTTCGAKRELQERVDSLEAERDQLTNAINELQKKQPYCYNPEQPLDTLNAIGRYIDELTAERDDLQNLIDQERLAHLARVDELEFQRDGISEKADRLMDKCAKLQEAMNRAAGNWAKKDAELRVMTIAFNSVNDKLTEKQHVCDVQRESFRKLECELAEAKAADFNAKAGDEYERTETGQEKRR